jgi:hypothetical protein
MLGRCIDGHTASRRRTAVCIVVLSAGVCQMHLAAQDQRPARTAEQVSESTSPSAIWSELQAHALSVSISGMDRSNPADEAKLIAVQNGPLLAEDEGSIKELKEQIREAIGMVSRIHISTLFFGPDGNPNETLVKSLRESLSRGHVDHRIWFNVPACGPSRDTTDLWWPLVRDHLRHEMLLVESRKSLTLVTIEGTFRTNGDVLHLHGYLGIPRFNACAVTGIEKHRPELDP